MIESKALALLDSYLTLLINDHDTLENNYDLDELVRITRQFLIDEGKIDGQTKSRPSPI
jgi:hypothetical protein